MERLQSDKDKNKISTFNSFYLETDNFKIYICYTFLGDAFMTEIRKDASEPSMLIYMPRQFKKAQTTLSEESCLLIKEGWKRRPKQNYGQLNIESATFEKLSPYSIKNI